MSFVNAFRTRLLNLPPDTAAEVFIDPAFQPVEYEPLRRQVMELLYPVGTVREKELLVTCYLKLIRAALLDEYVERIDPRITYTLDADFSQEVRTFRIPSLIANLLAFLDSRFDDAKDLFQKAPAPLVSLYKTYPDNLVRFAAALLILFGGY